MTLTQVGTVVGILATLGGGYAWDLGQRDEVHDVIVANSDRRAIESELQRTNLEIKFLLSIQESRLLNTDENERLVYLRELRAILVEQLKERT